MPTLPLHNDHLSYKDVLYAWKALQKKVIHTPVITSERLNQQSKRSVYLKCENLQYTGSFKFRGAYSLFHYLSLAEKNRGVLTFSSGNLGLAISLAAHLTNVEATLCMPQDISSRKLNATRRYGAEVLFYDRYKEDRNLIARQRAREKGRTLISNDHPAVIAGAGTVALELLKELSHLDAIVVPVSSGGLAAGTCLAVQGYAPSTRIYGVEPKCGNDTWLSLRNKKRTPIAPPNTIADGLRADIPGVHSFSINRRYLTDILLVSDEAIKNALYYAATHLSILLEPAGAASLAALLQGKIPEKRVGIILSGGNLDPLCFPSLEGSHLSLAHEFSN